MISFSVIVPNTNSRMIDQIVAALRRQTVVRDRMEILIVGEDGPGLLDGVEGCRFIPTPPLHASDKRNIGMREAVGDVLLFLDDDCVPDERWVGAHAARHDAGWPVVGGAVTFGRDNYLQLADNVSAFHDLLPHMPEGEASYLATANLSVHRSVVDRAGMMVPHQSRAEDLEWTARFRRLGYRLYFEPRAVVYHDPDRRDFKSLFSHWFDDAPETLRIRLAYPELLSTPRWARHRWLYLGAGPLIALWATWRNFRNRDTLAHFGYTLPLVYFTKLVWCWGAFLRFPRTSLVF